MLMIMVCILRIIYDNCCFTASRLEERESAQKEEFEKLHTRYNELLRTHIEHVERTKYLMGPDKFDMMQSLPMPTKTMTTSVDNNVRGISDLISAVHMSQSTHADMNLANHINNERDWQEEFGQTNDILQSPRDEFSDKEDTKSVLAEPDEQNVENEPKEPEDSLSADLTGWFLNYYLKQLNLKNKSNFSVKIIISITTSYFFSFNTGNLVDPAEFASAGNFLLFAF